MRTTRRRLLEAAAMGAALGLSIDWLAVAAEGSSSAAALPQADRALFTMFADTILPRTKTPGALDVGVVEFMEFMTTRGMVAAARAAFDVQRAALLADAKPYLRTSPGKRFKYVDALDRELFSEPRSERQTVLDGYAAVKRLTLIGYYTAERAALSELNVAPYPGPFFGSVPVDAKTRTFYEDSFGVPVERPARYLDSHE